MKTERLVALCKLWGVVKYFHPYLAYPDIEVTPTIQGLRSSRQL